MTRYNFAARKILRGAPRLPDCGLPQSGDTSRGDAIFSQRIPESFRRGLLGIAASGSKGGVWRRFPDRESPFRLAVINDEISQDFGRVCEVVAREFGMSWIELRGMWK